MKPDFLSSTSFSGSFSKLRKTVLSITQRSYGKDENSKAAFFPLCALDVRVFLSKYRRQVPGTWKQLATKMNVTQLLGSGWNCYLLAPRQDQRMDRNCQISSSADVLRSL